MRSLIIKIKKTLNELGLSISILTLNQLQALYYIYDLYHKHNDKSHTLIMN